jgi:hypothetical protein
MSAANRAAEDLGEEVLTMGLRPSLLLALASAALSTSVQAVSVQYSDYVAYVSVTIGGTHYACTTTSDPGCAFVTITASGDTSGITAFSVPGASGFTNAVGAADVTVVMNSGAQFSDTLLAGQLAVGVDQTNGGAGFGSAFGPTYPAATYGGGADYAHYALATNFFAQGFSGFCPDVALCDTGAPLHTTSGFDFTIAYPFRPNFSAFSSTVSAIPEPGSSGLLLAGVALLGLLSPRWRRGCE